MSSFSLFGPWEFWIFTITIGCDNLVSVSYQLITATLLFLSRLWRKAKLTKRRQCWASIPAPIKSCFISCLNRDIPKKKRKRSSGCYRPSWTAGMLSWQLTIQMWTSLRAFFGVSYWYDLAGKSGMSVTYRPIPADVSSWPEFTGRSHDDTFIFL